MMVENRHEMQSLHVKQPNSSNAVELIAGSGMRFVGVAFTPDVSSIYFTAYPPNDDSADSQMGRLYKIPVLGGPQKKIVDDIDSPVAISPDGKKLAFIRQAPTEGTSKLVVLEQGTTGQVERIVASRPFNAPFSNDGLSWSPDGHNIASIVTNEASAMDLLIVDAASGEQTAFNPEPLEWIGQTAWLADGKSILFTAFREGTSNFTDEIWFARSGNGKTRLVTDGIKGVSGISISGDSKSIAAVRSNRVTSLWVLSGDGSGPARIINKSLGDFSQVTTGIDWTPDGRLVYDSAADGNSDIWIANSDGSDLRKLTGDPGADVIPVVSNDGRYLVFVSNRTGDLNLWRMDIDGANAKQLTSLRNISSATISSDSKWVYFSASETKKGHSYAWKVPIDGGEPQKLTDRFCLSPQISPDDKYLACYYPRQIEPGKFGPPLVATILTADGSRIVRQFKDLPIGQEVPISWSVNGDGLNYAFKKNGVSNLWFQGLEAAEPKQITDFSTDEIFRFRFSKDGKHLAFEKGFRVNDVVLIRDTANLD